MTTLNFDLLFETSNQSIWDSGEAFNFTFGGNEGFIGLNWDESTSAGFTIPIPFFDDINVGFNASTSGQIGLQNTLNINGGNVSAFIPVDLSLIIPNEPVKAGETFTIHSGFSFDSNSTFTTSSPRASYALDLIFQLASALDLEPIDILDFNFSVDETPNLVNFDTESSNLNLTGDLGNLQIDFPNVNTQGTLSSSNALTSSGEDTFLNGDIDLDFIATTVLNALGVPVPPLEGSGSIDLGFIGDIGLEYNLLDVDATALLSILQEFALSGTLPGLLLLENGISIPFNVGEDITLTMPDNVGESLDINAVIDFNALFSNSTSLGLDFGVNLTAGQFELELPIIRDFSVTLFEDSVELFDTSFGIYNNTFNLGGFNQQQISFQVDTLSEQCPVIDVPPCGSFDPCCCCC